MKKVNQSQENCVPISSNCVSYRGPDLCCIEVCEGDTESDVIWKLARHICALEAKLDFSSLDLSCLAEGCEDCSSDKTPLRLFELLLAKVCTEAASVMSSESSEWDEPVMTVALNLRYADDNGDLVQELPLTDYVTKIGSEVSIQVNKIQTIESVQTTQASRIASIESSIPDEVTIPELNAPEVMPDNNAYPIEEVVTAVVEQFDALRTVVGSVEDLTDGISSDESASLNSEDRLDGVGTMSGISGWVTDVETAADSLKNLWLVILDMREAVADLIVNTAVSCSDLTVNYAVALFSNGTVARIYLNGYCSIPNGFSDCGDSTISVTDSLGNTYQETINVATLAASAGYHTIDLSDTPINTASDYTFELSSCLTNGTISCEKTIVKEVENNATICPQVTLTPGTETIGYLLQLALTTGVDYSVQLYNGEALVATNNHASPSSSFVASSFTGLDEGTTYSILITIRSGSTILAECDGGETTTTTTSP